MPDTGAAVPLADAPGVVGLLNYLETPDEPLRTYAYDPPGGGARFNGRLRACAMRIRDARRGAPGSLEREGYACVRHASRVRDLDDDEALHAVHYPEAEALVRELTGATRAVVFDHTLRRRAAHRPPLDGMGGSFAAMREPVGRVHLDYTPWSAPRRRDDVLAAHGLACDPSSPYVFIGLWRALHDEPLQDAPLALADARSVAAADLVPNDLIYPQRRGQTFAVLHNADHAWAYHPGLTREEVLVFRHYDSRTDADGVPRAVLHTAFEDPTTPADAPPRRSLELRALALFER